MKKSININGTLLDLSTPLVMGIVNITPNSFFAGSRKNSESEILEACRRVLDEGGTIIDIGGQSSSPVSQMISASEEIERLRRALQAIRCSFPDALLSVDTFYADVAKMAVEEFGVNIINDISGGQIDEAMFETVARLNVPYILMHMRGVPQTMQQLTQYDNLYQDLMLYFSEKLTKLHRLGVNDVIIDPGFGFSKTLEQNYELMSYLPYFDTLESPVLVGISRKSMLYKYLQTSPEEALNGTTVLNTFALMNGADILRVHDVKEAVECVKLISEIKKYQTTK